MLNKVNQGLLATVLLAAFLTAPQAFAVSDEVAVQLLDRLEELEKEVSNLRGENETLRNELETLRALQRAGFLDVDERVSGLEKQGGQSESLENDAAAVTLTPPQPQPSTNTQEQSVPVVTTNTTDSGKLPSAEEPVVSGSLPVATEPAQPTTPNAVGTTDTETTAEVADRDSVSNPEDRKAVAVADGTAQQPERVDPNSPESYYYYGTQERPRTNGEQQQPAAADTSKASLTQEKPAPTVAQKDLSQLPESHRAKAEYNEAYKLLVNDPKTAVPAFRQFLQTYPSHELAANAQYWLGEALYAQKDYSGASEEFMRVLKQHKGSPKAPGAALKLGYSFYELRQWDFARRTLEDTVRFFPDTNAAKLAQGRLQRMTAEGN